MRLMIGRGGEGGAYVKVFRVLPDGTILHVVLLGVLEAELEVESDCVESWILSGFYPRLDLVESDWILDLLKVIRVLTLGRETEELDGKQTTAEKGLRMLGGWKRKGRPVLFVCRILDCRPERKSVVLELDRAGIRREVIRFGGTGWHGGSLRRFFSSFCAGGIDVDRAGTRDPFQFSLHSEREGERERTERWREKKLS